MPIHDTIAQQFANQLLISRNRIAAADLVPNDVIGDAATSRYQAILQLADYACHLVRKQTAPPAISEEVLRQVNGRQQPIRIVPAATEPDISPSEIHAMALRIARYVAESSRATAAADQLALQTIASSPPAP